MHLRQGLRSELEPELGDEPKPSQDPEGILSKAVLGHRAKPALLEVCHSTERVDERSVRQASCDRIHGEVTPRHVRLDRDAPVCDDREVLVGRASRALDASRRELDPLRRKDSHRPIRRVETHADSLAVHLEILDPAVGRKRIAKRGLIDARNEKVFVVVGQAQQLVAH